MNDRDNRFDEDNGRHFSAREAAKFCAEHRVGKRYATWGQVWDVPNDLRTVGLLEMIYECVNKTQPPTDSQRLEAHSYYVQNLLNRDSRSIQFAMKQILRLEKMCHGVTSFWQISEFQWFFTYCDIHSLSETYVACETTTTNRFAYRRKLNRLDAFINHLTQIRSVDGFITFPGFGKRSVQKLKAEIAEAKRKKKAK